MKQNIESLLLSLGVTRSYRGYLYFIEAVRMAAEEPDRLTCIREKIYQPIARAHRTTIFNVEKNLRTIRDVIVRNQGLELLIQLTGASFLRNTTPYPRELIELFSENCILPKDREGNT